jgi:hypothetical protein
MADSELAVAGTFPNRVEAELAQGALAAAGVESVISADDVGGQYASVWATSVRLLVRIEDRVRAKEILSQPT